MRWTPYQYQLDAAKFLLERSGAGLWLEPGLGKTSCTLAALAVAEEPALVIAPLRAATLTWPAETEKWDDFRFAGTTVLHGSNKLKILRQESPIQVINPEGLPWLFDNVRPSKWPWKRLVLDESTRFKSWSAKRTKLLRQHFHRFTSSRWCLTGTPAPNGLQDIFAQVYFMDGGKRLGKFITHFRNQYMYPGKYPGEYHAIPGKHEEVMDKIKDLVMFLRAEDWLDMPKLLTDIRYIDLPPVTMRDYRILEKDMVMLCKGGKLLTASGGKLVMKLRQVVAGQVYMEDGSAHFLHDEKTGALVELIEELNGNPLLVAVAFKFEVEAIRKALGYDVPYIGGGCTPAQSRKIVDEWNKGKVPVLLAHPTSVAHGLNLQAAAHHLCWLSLTWNFEEFDQFVRRLWRQGQTKPVVMHFISARNTIDARLAYVLSTKDREQKTLTEIVRVYEREILK